MKTKDQSTHFDDLAHDYEDIMRQTLGHWGGRTGYYAEYKVRLLKSMSLHPDPGSVLDFGCGIGRNLPFLRSAYPRAEIWGYDISRECLALAGQRNPDCRFMGPGDGERRFDLILVSCVFHHIPVPERRKTAGRICRLMNPGAQCFIFEHNPYNPVTRRLVNTCPFDRDAELLKSGRTAALLQEAGLHVIRRRYTLFFPAALRFLAPIEKAFNRLPLGGQYVVQAMKE